MKKRSIFRHFNTSPEIIRLAVNLDARFPPLLRNTEDFVHERDVEVNHKTIRFWWKQFRPNFLQHEGQECFALARHHL